MALRPSIATVCLAGTLREKLEAAAAAGFTAVEIFENDLIAFPGSPGEISRLCDDLGLAIVAYQPFRDFEGMPEHRRAKTLDRANRKFDLMAELGTDLLLVCSNVAPDSLGGIDRLAADFSDLGERAGKRGLRVGYEALAWGRHVNDYRDAWEVVRRADHSAIGLILDTFHIAARRTDLAAMRAIPGDRIFLVQVADAPRLEMDTLSWSRHWRCMPYQGDLDLRGFMQALEATEYDGALSLEIFNDRFRAGSTRAVAIDGHRSLICLIDDSTEVAKHLPPRASVDGIEFLEFAVDHTERVTLETLLAALGFARVGRHRSKDVALWRQGHASIVVNADRQGFAHSYQLSHGLSVCALALRVADAAATFERARALLDVPHADAIGAGELDIPALRGLGGSLLYFIDDKDMAGKPSLAHWADVDFEPTGESAEGAGLSAIDHVAQAMHYDEMLTWLLFYTSLLDCRKTAEQSVIDPGGVVQSQAIESGLGDAASAGLRLILNGSQSHRTQAARFVTDFFGSGVQHIAFATADIIATLSRLKTSGIEMLTIPGNYYDDLAARFDLSSAEIGSMRTLNILYDEDAGGSFRHAYMAALDGGLFFEIVERRGYQGYGAPNSAIRLAAQTQVSRAPGMPRLTPERG